MKLRKRRRHHTQFYHNRSEAENCGFSIPSILNRVPTGRFLRAHGATVGLASSNHPARPHGTLAPPSQNSVSSTMRNRPIQNEASSPIKRPVGTLWFVWGMGPTVAPWADMSRPIGTGRQVHDGIKQSRSPMKRSRWDA
jgi:hypothetical protein